jgi:arylsulfatase A-like enzyme
VVPSDAELTPRNDAFPAWDSLPEDQQKLYARQMEVYAGYQENADHNVGRVLDAIAEMGELEDTLVIWIWGDNGSSMEGTLTGSFNELTMQNGIPLTPEQQLALVQQYGGLEVWGSELIAPTSRPPGPGPGTPPSSGASRSPRTLAAPATRSSTGQPASATRARSASSSAT